MITTEEELNTGFAKDCELNVIKSSKEFCLRLLAAGKLDIHQQKHIHEVTWSHIIAVYSISQDKTILKCYIKQNKFCLASLHQSDGLLLSKWVNLEQNNLH